MPVLLSRHEALLAADGCRHLASKLRVDEKVQYNELIKAGMLRSAGRLERLAQIFDDHAGSVPTI